MIDIKLLRAEPDRIRRALQRRHSAFDLDALLELDAKRRGVLYELEQGRAEQNRTSAAIAQAKKSGGDAAEAIEAPNNNDIATRPQIRVRIITPFLGIPRERKTQALTQAAPNCS